jgi:DNA replication protein DnaT
MAGDWIKADHALPDKPEVWRMASLLKISPEAVVGHLLRVWVWADQQSVNVNVDGSTDAYVDVDIATIDAVARLPGFADAMLKAKWLKFSDGRITFPDLQGYISESAKLRALRNRRQSRYRSAQRSEGKTSPPAPQGAALKKRAPRKPKGNGQDNGGLLSDAGIQALGLKLGLSAHAGESMDAFRARVLAEDRRRHDG